MPRRNPVTQADPAGQALATAAFEHYAGDLHRFLVRRLPRAQDAADLMQEVFLRLLRLKRIELIRNPQAYLFGIASRVIRDHRIGTSGERVIFDSDLAMRGCEHPEVTSADTLADGVSLERQIERALQLLSPIQAQIFLLERCQGLAQSEIALKLSISPHTVKKYSVQALAFVRRQLAVDTQEAHP